MKNSVNIPINNNGKDIISDPISCDFLEGIIHIGEPINDELAIETNAKLRYLNRIGKSPIYLYIQSPGGSVSAGLSILDTINNEIDSEVYTIATGMVASMAAFLLANAAPKGNRYAMPNSTILLHQPIMNGVGGQATEISIVANEILKTKKKLNKMLSKATGQPIKKISADTERDYYLNAQEAQIYGLVDNIGSPLSKEV